MAREWLIEIEKRETRGTGAARRLRKAGSIPAILYGAEGETVAISVTEKQVGAVVRSGRIENTLLTLRFRDSGESCPALVREVQVEPLASKLLHADFLRVSLTKEVQVEVPIEFQGVPAGVRTEGGLFDVIRRELMVACLPTDMPDYLRVDVTNLAIGDVVRVQDVPVPERVRILVDPATTIAHVMAPALVEEAAPAAAVEEAPAEPEVIGKGKAAEEGEEAAEEEEGKEGKPAKGKGKEPEAKEEKKGKEEKKDKKDKKERK